MTCNDEQDFRYERANYIRGGSKTIRLGPKAGYCKTLVKKTTMPVATPSSVFRTRDRKLTKNSYIERDVRMLEMKLNVLRMSKLIPDH